jgi:L-threonylcarbamoyladenylate synthase
VVNIIISENKKLISEAAYKLNLGNLVAFPTETVYGLGADALNSSAVARIYDVKGRPTKHPLIVHISSLKHLNKWAKEIPEYGLILASTFWPGPMTLILPRTSLAKNFITGGQDNVGVRIPAHSIALELLGQFENKGGLGVAAPSANRFGAVSPTTAGAVEIELGDYLESMDLILDGGPSLVGVESTIIDCTKSFPTILRPGAITEEMITEVLGSTIKIKSLNPESIQVSAPGMLESHYSPEAKVLLNGVPLPGDGFIALDSFTTPAGAIRIAAPKTNEEYAQVLYEAFRVADFKGIGRVFVIPPTGNGIAVAINDRLTKSAFEK